MAPEPLAVLLLPAALEDFALREHAEALLRAPGVVAIEPGRTPYASVLSIPPRAVTRMARGQAGRLVRRLPGRVAVVVVFDALQWPLAEQLLARVRGAELWLAQGAAVEPGSDRLRALREELAAAAAFAYAADAPAAEVTAQLLERLRARGVRVD